MFWLGSYIYTYCSPIILCSLLVYVVLNPCHSSAHICAFYCPALFNSCRKKNCVATVNAAKQLVKLLFSELNIQPHQVEILKLVVTVLLYLLCKMEIIVARNELDESEVAKTFGALKVVLEDWVKRGGIGVVGGSFFGYRVQNDTTLLYGSTELKVLIYLVV